MRTIRQIALASACALSGCTGGKGPAGPACPGGPGTPMVLTAPVAAAPAGFGATVRLGVTVSGGTPPYTFAWSARATNATAVTLSDAAVQSPTFTTGTLKEVLASGRVLGVTGLDRLGFVPISTQQLSQMTYKFDCKVTDSAGFSRTVALAVPPATPVRGDGVVRRNQVVVLNVPDNAATLDFTSRPAGAAARLHEPDQVNPWFVPDVAGDYTVAGLTVRARDLESATPACGICHTPSGIQVGTAWAGDP